MVVIDDLQIAGAQRVIVQEARALHPGRVAFSVVALSSAPERSFAPELRASGVAVYHLRGRGLLDVRRMRRLVELIRRLSPDLVHTHLTYANIVGTIAARLSHRPSVATLHNVDSNQLRSAVPKRWLESFVLRRWAARVAVVAEGARDPVGRAFGLPTPQLVTVPNGVDPRSIALPADYNRTAMRRSLGLDPGERLLCNIGRLEPSKGQRYFLEALVELRTREPGCRFRALLIGSGPELHALQRLVTQLGLCDRVQLPGLRSDIAEVLAASDLFVLSSLNEGLSQALLEAMALGVPVVATDVGGTSDAVLPGQTGWLVPPAEAGSLARAIQHALGNRREATRRARAARELVGREFSLSDHVAHLEKLYRGVECYGVRHRRRSC